MNRLPECRSPSRCNSIPGARWAPAAGAPAACRLVFVREAIRRLAGAALLAAALSLCAARAADDPRGAEKSWQAILHGFNDKMFPWVDGQLSGYLKQHPQGPHRASAILLQAQCRLALRDLADALALLRQNQANAGPLADQYQYWIGKVELEQGQYAPAAADFGVLLKDFPKSSLRLNAAYDQAYAWFKAGDVPKTVLTLNSPKGDFQLAAAASTNSPLVGEGYLLLAQALRAQGDYRAAEDTLRQLHMRNPGAEVEWRLQYSIARTELASGRLEDALKQARLLVASTTPLNAPVLKAQSLNLEAEILMDLKRPEEARPIYEQIFQMKGLDVADQRKALLTLIDLAANQHQLTEAIQRLQAFIDRNPQDVSMDLLRLTLGELRLKQFYALQASAATSGLAGPALTNFLDLAQADFDAEISSFTNSSYVGKAYLNKGWCLWEKAHVTGETDLFRKSLAAFQTAAVRLPRSADQAMALFKSADCAFELKDYPDALAQYGRLVNEYSGDADVRDKNLERALYQMIRASIETRQLDRAKAAINQMLAWFPTGELADNSLLLYGQALAEEEKFDASRAIFQSLVERYPNSPLVPEVSLAMARTCSQEGQWTQAVKIYDQWLAKNTTSAERSQVEFDRAWANYQAGNEGQALVLFTNYVARYWGNDLAPIAQMWVGDHYFRSNDFVGAGLSYQKLFSLPANERFAPLICQARLMAGYAAFYGQSYSDARAHLTNLLNNCPPALAPEALFLLGNTYTEDRSADPTNALSNFKEALVPFERIVKTFPSDRFAPLAWGRIADCKLQLASQNPALLSEVTNAYGQVLLAPAAEVAARSQAEVGWGAALEKMAEGRPPPEKESLLEQALNHYLDVVYGAILRSGEPFDPFWVKKAALNAARLAEVLDRKPQAMRLYRRLEQLIPSMKPSLDKKLRQLEQPLESSAR